MFNESVDKIFEQILKIDKRINFDDLMYHYKN